MDFIFKFCARHWLGVEETEPKDNPCFSGTLGLLGETVKNQPLQMTPVLTVGYGQRPGVPRLEKLTLGQIRVDSCRK